MSTYELQISVQPRYLPEQSAPQQGLYRFAYTITITNTGEGVAQLIARHWHISDANGHVEEVRGLGVVGRQPALKPGESFEYTSGCELQTSSGTMHGHYLCVTEEGDTFDTPIPLFLLEAEGTEGDSAHSTPRVLH